MKKISTIFLAVLISCFIFSSCEKTTTDQVSSGNIITGETTTPFQTPEYRQALIKSLSDYFKQNAAERDLIVYPPVFFTSTGFGFFNDDFTQLVSFSTQLDGNDFFRVNADGTVTVHIASNDALSEVEVLNNDTGEYEYFYGENGHMAMNYTGPVELVSFDFQGTTIYYYAVVPDADSPATVWHGNGKVRLNGDTGPKKNLVGHLTASAGWENVNIIVNLN